MEERVVFWIAEVSREAAGACGEEF